MKTALSSARNDFETLCFLHDAGTCSCVEMCLELLRSPKANVVLVGPLTFGLLS